MADRRSEPPATDTVLVRALEAGSARDPSKGKKYNLLPCAKGPYAEPGLSCLASHLNVFVVEETGDDQAELDTELESIRRTCRRRVGWPGALQGAISVSARCRDRVSIDHMRGSALSRQRRLCRACGRRCRREFHRPALSKESLTGGLARLQNVQAHRRSSVTHRGTALQ